MLDGALKSIEAVIRFYDTRDVLPNCATVFNPCRGGKCWPAPDVLENVNGDGLGNLGLTDPEERWWPGISGP